MSLLRGTFFLAVVVTVCVFVTSCMMTRGGNDLGAGGHQVVGTATYSVEEFGLDVTLPGDYQWRTSDFKYGVGPSTLAEWISSDGQVGGVLDHLDNGWTATQCAEESEKYFTKAHGVTSVETTNQEQPTGKQSGTWLVREYKMTYNGSPLREVWVFVGQGSSNVRLWTWCGESQWSESRDAIYKIARSLECAGRPPEAFTGIYSLQALIDFDCLDGAAVDPATGAVSLFGHRTRDDRFVSVPYLDHLATAMECESPTFSLEWAPGSEAEVNKALDIDADHDVLPQPRPEKTQQSSDPRAEKIRRARNQGRMNDSTLNSRLSDLFDDNGHLTKIGAWWYGLGGAKVKVGYTRYGANAQALFAIGRDDDAHALGMIEAYEEAIKKNDEKTAAAAFELLCKFLDIYDKAKDYWDQSQQGKITEAQYLDEVQAMFMGAIAKLFGQDAKTYEDMYWSERQKGRDAQTAMETVMTQSTSPENQKKWLRDVIFNERFKSLSAAHVPPEICAEILGVIPRVTPVFDNLPARSLLARVAFDADILGKRLMIMPEIKDRIPKYRTFFEWRNTINQPPQDKEGHLWFSPDRFELKESTDGNVMEFGRTQVRINLARKDGDRSIEDPVLRQYGDELTGLYDDFAREFPVLHELRECMKVTALSGWLEKKGMKLDFPKEGRCYWNPPKEAEGIVEMVMAVKNEGPVGEMLWALGGIAYGGGIDWDGNHGGNRDLAELFRANRDADAVPLKDLTAVRSLKETNTALTRFKLDTPDHAPPLPEPPCAVGQVQAQSGRRAIKYVVIRENALAGRTDCEEYLLLERIRRKAQVVDAYDRMLNAATKERGDAMKDLTQMRKEGEEVMDDFYSKIGELLISMGNARLEVMHMKKTAKVSPEAFVKLAQLFEQVNDLKGDLETGIEAGKEGKFDPEHFAAVSGRFTELGVLITNQIKVLRGTNPNIADYFELRTTVGINVAMGVGELGIAFSEILYREKMMSDLNDQMGKQLVDQKALNGNRKKALDDLDADLKTLKSKYGK